MSTIQKTADPQEDGGRHDRTAESAHSRDLVNLQADDGNQHEAANNKNDNNIHHDWLTLIPSILERRNFQCTEQTRESARALMESGLLGNFTRANEHSLLSLQVEASLLESFVEDDYDGALHLTTLDVAVDDDDDNNNNNGGHRPIGLVFWRQVSKEEMRDWIDWGNLRKRIQGEQERKLQSEEESREEEGLDEQQDEEYRKQRRMRHSLRSVRRESVRWLEVATRANNSPPAPTANALAESCSTNTTSMLVETLTHCWVKLELLVVHSDYWKQHIGTLLLACAMYQAYQNGDDHMILHIAGGKRNIPALRLYEKFGFLPVPQGTVFRKPDKDLYVLGHVGQSLQRLCWPALEL